MKTTYVFDKLLEATVDPDVRGVSSRGGTRSSKTWSMLQLLYIMARESETPLLISCVTDTMPGIKRGMFRDFKRMLQDEGVWDDKCMNLTESIYSLENGSQIEFFGCEDSSKVFGPARDILFVNEAQRVPFEVFRQMAVRTRLMLYIDFNPVKKFWAHDYFKGPGMVEIVSTYKDNPYLTPEQIEEIERNKQDENWWRIFGLGETGGVEGLVYPDYDVVPEFPADVTGQCLGLDFGFTGDPTAIVRVGFKGSDLYIQELEYRTGMVNWDISEVLHDLGFHKTYTIADSAEQKSITEISRLGCKIIPCIKGKGSVVAGISEVRQFKLHVVAGSRNVQDEFDQYSWTLDRMTGMYDTTKPQDANNHAMDALRYAVDYLITKYRPGAKNQRKNG